MICSTSHRQREVHLLLLVAGAVLACVLLYFLKAFFSLFFHFMVYSVETVTGAFWALLLIIIIIFIIFISFFLFFISFFSSPVSFIVLRKIVTLNILKIIYFTLLLLVINANNDRFAVLCNRYFSACDWRFIRCQFVADLKENPGGVPVTVKYRRPYASTVVTDSILYIVAAIWRDCRKFESCT